MNSKPIKPNYALIYRELFTKELSKGEKTKIKIAEKGIAILAKDGLHGFSLDSVAKALKTTRSHVTYYFSTSEELLEFQFKMIIQNAQHYTIKQLEGKTDPWKLIDGIATGASLWLYENPTQAQCWISFFEISSRNETMKNLNHEIRSGGLHRLIEVLSLIHPESSISLIQNQARAMQSYITGELINFFTTHQQIKFEKLLETMIKNCRALANGV